MLTIDDCGYHSQHPESFEVNHPNGIPCYLLIFVNVPCYFRLNSEKLTVPENTFFLFRPNEPYYYTSINTEFINDWLHFTCTDPNFDTECESLFQRPLQTKNPLQFSQYFQNIVWEHNYADEQYRNQNTSMLLRVMLNKLLQEVNLPLQYKAYYPYTLKLQQLRLSMQAHPTQNYSATELSDTLNISPSYFHSLYKTVFGIPFKSDLIQMRMNFAITLIRDTDIKLSQIALMSGYTNEIHFYRQFKAKMGMTPNEYRQMERNKHFKKN